jgi:dihydrofolate reductase
VKATVFVGASLDGFIARTNGDLDWLPHGEVEDHGYDAFIATVDALVMGRNTYDKVLTFGTWPYGEKPVFVLSSRSLPAAPSGAVVEPMAGDPADIVSRLSGRGIEHVYVDGGITIQRFLQAGLIQRIIVTWIPMLHRYRHPAVRSHALRYPAQAHRDASVCEWARAERV